MRKLTIAILLLLVGAASAETITVRGTSKQRDVTLKAGDRLEIRGTSNSLKVKAEGGKIEFHGSSNQLVLTGHAESIDVRGTSNKLRLDAQVDSVKLHGGSNEVVLVQREKRPLPTVEQHGQGNKVTTEVGH